MGNASSGDADKRVDVGLLGKLDGVRSDGRSGAVDNQGNRSQSRVPRRRKVKALEETESGSHCG